MKISCTQENLNQGLFIVSHLATKNINLPILNNILFQVSEKTIKLSATNLEIGINCVIRGKVDQEGEFTVQSRLLADYVSLLPKDRVDIEVSNDPKEDQNQILKINCRNYSTKIKGQLAVDFPVIPQIEKDNPYILDYNDFKKAMGQVIFAVSVNETRPEIGGVSFNFTGGKLVLAATDSYRLAEKAIDLDKKSNSEEKRIIIPVKTLQELSRILGSFKDSATIADIKNIEIYLTENQILFVLGDIELISRLVEGQYPDYKQIIPQQTNTKAILDVSELAKAVKTTSLFARSGIYDVGLQFVANKKEVVVSSTNNQIGESVSKITCDLDGGDNNIVVNYRYLLDGLQNINSDKVEIAVIDSGNPCVLKPAGKDLGYLYIIMPIKQ